MTTKGHKTIKRASHNMTSVCCSYEGEMAGPFAYRCLGARCLITTITMASLKALPLFQITNLSLLSGFCNPIKSIIFTQFLFSLVVVNLDDCSALCIFEPLPTSSQKLREACDMDPANTFFSLTSQIVQTVGSLWLGCQGLEHVSTCVPRDLLTPPPHRMLGSSPWFLFNLWFA